MRLLGIMEFNYVQKPYAGINFTFKSQNSLIVVINLLNTGVLCKPGQLWIG